MASKAGPAVLVAVVGLIGFATFVAYELYLKEDKKAQPKNRSISLAKASTTSQLPPSPRKATSPKQTAHTAPPPPPPMEESTTKSRTHSDAKDSPLSPKPTSPVVSIVQSPPAAAARKISDGSGTPKTTSRKNSVADEVPASPKVASRKNSIADEVPASPKVASRKNSIADEVSTSPKVASRKNSTSDAPASPKVASRKNSVTAEVPASPKVTSRKNSVGDEVPASPKVASRKNSTSDSPASPKVASRKNSAEASPVVVSRKNSVEASPVLVSRKSSAAEAVLEAPLDPTAVTLEVAASFVDDVVAMAADDAATKDAMSQSVTSDGFVELRHADAGDIVEQVEQVVMECEDADTSVAQVEDKPAALAVEIPEAETTATAEDKDSPTADETAAGAEAKTTPTSGKNKKKKKKKKGKK
ncbi:hypothetical protein ACHHYP_08369 [Achlya hypogyna]|uniref:Uncharacterized protein n=1 Tax=Achlya hypogyna TaxID=1202772 RepID=A0A1V9ZKW5_ACHHY|nr:hypothetical protein ACHHYP_08369 [Achlya hypogyna]